MKRAPQFVIDVTAKRPKMYRILCDGSQRDVLQGPKRPMILQERKDDLPRPLDTEEIQQLAQNWHEANPDKKLRSFYKHMFHGDINATLAAENTFVTATSKALAVLKTDQDALIKTFMDPALTRPTNAVFMVDDAICMANENLMAGVFDEDQEHDQFNLCVYMIIHKCYERAYKKGFNDRMDEIQKQWPKYCKSQYHK